MSVPFPYPTDRPVAEVLRGRDGDGRPMWALDQLVRGERDRTVSRVEIAHSDRLRDVLDAALLFERKGGFVRRGGLAR